MEEVLANRNSWTNWSDIRLSIIVLFIWKYSAQLSLCSAWLSLFLSLFLRGWGSGYPNFFLCLSSSLVNPRFHTENQLCIMPGSALKVCVGGGGGQQ